MRVLLVLSAKYVEKEMQHLVGIVPPLLITIEKKLVIDHIYKNNIDDFDKIVVVGYEGIENLENYISHKGYKIFLHKLDRLEDIGYSINHYLSSENDFTRITSLSIIFGDTFLYNIPKNTTDSAYFSYTEESERWTTFDEDNGFCIFDKEEVPYRDNYKSFVGYFTFLKPVQFKNYLDYELSKNSTIDSFYRSFSLYNNQFKVEFIQIDNWLDLGHIDTYFEAKKDVDTRFFNTIEIDKESGILKKKSDDKEKFINEIKWYLKLPDNLQYLTPRIFNYSLNFENPYVEMEYYPYNTLHEMFVYGEYSINTWKKILKRLLKINTIFTNYKISLTPDKVEKALGDVYINKTKARLNSLRSDNNFKNYFTDNIKINGVRYESLDFYIDMIDVTLKKLDLGSISNFNIIHGDFFFANILYDTRCNIVKLIDPRGSFSHYGIYGDNYYELAKLSHSLDGKYDFIIEDLFTIEEKEGSEIKFSIHSSPKHDLIKNIFYGLLDIKDINRVKFIQGLLFLSMIPLHKDSILRQKVMLATGVMLVDEIIKLLVK